MIWLPLHDFRGNENCFLKVSGLQYVKTKTGLTLSALLANTWPIFRRGNIVKTGRTTGNLGDIISSNYKANKANEISQVRLVLSRSWIWRTGEKNSWSLSRTSHKQTSQPPRQTSAPCRASLTGAGNLHSRLAVGSCSPSLFASLFRPNNRQLRQMERRIPIGLVRLRIWNVKERALMGRRRSRCHGAADVGEGCHQSTG